jgi:EmrB/QacA subfamily drug resistance transporter
MSTPGDERAFPILSPSEIAEAATFGSEKPVSAGELLFEAGEETYELFVILDGEVEIVRDDSAEASVIASYGPGAFVGELTLLTGQRRFLTARVTEPGRVLVIEQEEFRRLMSLRPALAETIFRALVARREILRSGEGAQAIRIVGSSYSPEAMSLRAFAEHSRLAHSWIDVEDAEDVDVLLQTMGLRREDTPVVITPTEVLRRASPATLAEHLGLALRPTPGYIFDLIVVGSGPAGLAAAVYGASEGLSTVCLDAVTLGGQAGTSSRIENFMGFPNGISGSDLTGRAAVQAMRLGARLNAPSEVVGLHSEVGFHAVTLGDGSEIPTRAVIVASGARYRRLAVEDLGRFEGAGVYYAATELEARVCDGAPVLVIGGGNSAGQASIYLAQHNCAVTIAIRRDDLAQSMSHYLIERIEADPKITLLTGVEVQALAGRDHLEQATLRHTDSDRLQRPVLLHRRKPGDRVAGGQRAARSRRLHPHRPPVAGPTGCGDLWRPALRDVAAGCVRRRRRPARLDEASGRGGRRGIERRAIGPRASRDGRLRLPRGRYGSSMPARSSASVKRLTLVACILGSGIVLLDGTVVNVALPTIQRALGGGLAAQQWVVNGYLLTLGSLILIGGSLGDLFGERRVFAIGVASFGVASVLCAAAPSVGVLVAARALQGIAGALLVPSSLAVIVNTFPEAERGAAIGSWTAWGAIAGVLGPLAGGELLAIASWRWIFLINVPLATGCVALILTAIPASAPREKGARRVDVPGALLCAAGLGGPVFALIEQPRLGWSSLGVLVPLAAGAALLVLFTLFESRTRDPMLPLGLFRRRNFSAGNVETFAMYAGLAILFFFLILFLQQIGGYSPLKSGLATLPVTVVMFFLSRRFGALADRFGPRIFMGAGPLVAAGGLLLFQTAGTQVDYLSEVLPPLLIFALGLSMTVAPLTAAVLQGAEGEAGIASGVNNAIARVAGLLGTAAVGAAIASAFASAFVSAMNSKLAGTALGSAARAAVSEAKRLPLGRPDVHGMPAAQAHAVSVAAESASLHAFHLGMAIAAALVAIGGLVGAAGIRNPARADVKASDCAGGQLVGVSSPEPISAG